MVAAKVSVMVQICLTQCILSAVDEVAELIVCGVHLYAMKIKPCT